MVTSMILSRHKGDIPQEGACRKIEGGPLYADVLDLIGSCSALPWTRKCIRDLQELAMDEDDIKSMLVEAVKTGRFIDSEWCEGGRPGVWAACDAYRFVHRTWCEAAYKEIVCNYFIKFFVNDLGAVVFIVSFHLSN